MPFLSPCGILKPRGINGARQFLWEEFSKQLLQRGSRCLSPGVPHLVPAQEPRERGEWLVHFRILPTGPTEKGSVFQGFLSGGE